MKHKLFSVLLCVVASILLVGAGVEEDAVAASFEEGHVQIQMAAGSVQRGNPDLPDQAVYAAAGISLMDLVDQLDPSVRIDGEYAPADICKVQEDGTTYVALAAMAAALDSEIQVNWDQNSETVTITTSQLKLTAKVGQLYLEANGRYLYIPERIQLVDGKVTVPLWAVTKAFDAKLSWDDASDTVLITRGSGALQSGDTFYNHESLFWLSRVIHAESGNQPLEGKMAVGNVIMNRVESPIFPNTVQGVLAQKNQFSTYKKGALANRTPNAGSVIAAKLVLDGGEVEETENALYFDSCSTSWAARNKTYVATIGGHKFYR
ncbi:MAG: cell wall hydrolase [Clostridium sp.]|nr:cell wall hydrolase [Clostridium sp.]